MVDAELEYEAVDSEPEELQTVVKNQTSLFDLSGRKLNLNFVDENTTLYIPNRAKHWKAYKLQQMIRRLETQAERNPAQFNSGNFMEILNQFEKIVGEIHAETESSASGLGSPEVASDGNEERPHEVGERIALGVHTGVSADNPLAG